MKSIFEIKAKISWLENLQSESEKDSTYFICAGQIESLKWVLESKNYCHDELEEKRIKQIKNDIDPYCEGCSSTKCRTCPHLDKE